MLKFSCFLLLLNGQILMKTYFLKLLYQILFTKIDEEPISSEYSPTNICPTLFEAPQAWNYQSPLEIKLPQSINNQYITRLSLDLAQMVIQAHRPFANKNKLKPTQQNGRNGKIKRKKRLIDRLKTMI